MANVLLIEDEVTVHAVLEDFCGRNNHNLSIVGTLAEAETLMDTEGAWFDIAICDLKIPSAARSVDEDIAHGLSALAKLMDRYPGVPIVVCSGYGTIDVIADMLNTARQIDIYGTGDAQPMLRFSRKSRLRDETLRRISEAQEHLDQLNEIELDAPELTDAHRRALRIFARRRSGALIQYQPLSGGLSGAHTGLATVRNAYGAQVARVVSKIASYRNAIDEHSRYQSHIAGQLGAGCYADLSDRVLAGCGDVAGLFYSVADAFANDLFTLIETDATLAASTVAKLQSFCHPWVHGSPQTTKTWMEVRQGLISKDAYEDIRGKFDIQEVPDHRSIQVRWISQHGDLHGGNVLVDEDGRPVLIDFGRSGLAPSVLDPITLELSLLFHPDSPFKEDEWPAKSQLENWRDLDLYLSGCPYPDFVRACRNWAIDVGVGRRDLYGTVSAYCLRNLKFDDTDVDRALVLQRASSAWLLGT